MKKNLRLLISLGIACCLNFPISTWANPTPAENTHEVDQRLDFLYGQHVTYAQFLKNFQSATQEREKVKVANMIHYPIKINLDGKKVQFKSAQQLLQRYDDIFDPMLVNLIQAQKYENLFANTQGIMIGESGELWFSGFCLDKSCQKVSVKIIAINK